MIKLLLRFLTVICLTTGCTKNAHVEDFQVGQAFEDYYKNRLVSSRVDTTTFNTCSFIKNDWDSILVVPPYVIKEKVKSLGIENYSEISDKIYQQSLNEDTYTLLFVSNSRYVGYSVIRRQFIDLSFFMKEEDKPFLWITKKMCNKFNIVRFEDRYQLVLK